MPRFDRIALMHQFQQMVQERRPIIGGGAGTGLSAKCEEEGGIDLIIIYNSGRYRMAGRGSLAGLLAYGNANDIVMDMAHEVLPVVHKTPVLAGVNGTDPFCLFDSFLDDISRIGFSGVQNFPSVGLIDGVFRANLEETGMGYALEVDMIRLAHQKGLLTTPYVFDEQQAVAMVEAGADILVAHMGLTTGGSIGAATALTLHDCVERINHIAAAALKIRPDILILCHGGPIATPEDAQFILQSCDNCHGFFGASSMERMPTEHAVTNQTKAFKALSYYDSIVSTNSTQSARIKNKDCPFVFEPSDAKTYCLKQAMEHTVYITEMIAAPVEKIWEIMRNFNGLPSFHPAIKASRIEQGDGESIGSIRYLTLESGYVREELLMFDEKRHRFDYAIIGGTLPVEHYKASVQLTFDATHNHTICEWWADFDVVNPADRDALIDLVGQHVFKVGFQSILALFANRESVGVL